MPKDLFYTKKMMMISPGRGWGVIFSQSVSSEIPRQVLDHSWPDREYFITALTTVTITNGIPSLS